MYPSAQSTRHVSPNSTPRQAAAPASCVCVCQSTVCVLMTKVQRSARFSAVILEQQPQPPQTIPSNLCRSMPAHKILHSKSWPPPHIPAWLCFGTRDTSMWSAACCEQARAHTHTARPLKLKGEILRDFAHKSVTLPGQRVNSLNKQSAASEKKNSKKV